VRVRATARIVLFVFSLDALVLTQVQPLVGSAIGMGRVVAGAGMAFAQTGTACDEALLGGQSPVVFVSRSELWPPNHALLDVGLGIDLTPACVNQASVHLSVWSDEPDENQTGDGNFPVDAQIDGSELYLRAERRGDSDGRVYLILVTATGPSDATGTDCETVTVPKNRSRSSLDSVAAQAQSARSYCEAHSAPVPGFHLLAEGDPVRANQPPRVEAGPDQGIDLGATAILDGTVTDDGLPAGNLVISWTKLSGPGDVTFGQAQSADTTAAFTTAGTYVLRLSATDTALSASDDVQVVVDAANEAPLVDAGPDLSVTLPTLEVALSGIVTDDGRPDGTLAIAWSQVGGSGAVWFSDPTSVATTAFFPSDGVYVLRLSASDGQLTTIDDVQISVSPEPLPELQVSDASVIEGADGVQGAVFQLSLSKPWATEVTADYMTFDGTAAAPCDYLTRYGTARVPAGETQASVLVPVIGELQPESIETVVLRLGNISGATLARSEAALSIADDDAANAAPGFGAARAPAFGASGVALPPTFAWSATDPDGDSVSYDVHLGSVFAPTGQVWNAVCPTTAGPSPRVAAAAALDEASDRLVVFGGADDDPDRVWILRNATGAGGPPEWLALTVPNGPGGLKGAAAAFDTDTNRLIVFGGCSGSCGTASAETWVLTNANGLGAPPQWIRLDAMGPAGRHEVAAAYDAASKRFVVFGGAAGAGGASLGDAWLLRDANGLGEPAWEALSPAGPLPAARHAASAAWDPASGALLLFGGLDADGRALGDLWALERATTGLPVWRQLLPSASGPAARWGHAAAFDPASRRLLVFGGSTARLEEGRNFVFNDAWLVHGPLEAGPEWARLTPTGVVPPGRLQPVTAYSASENRLVIALGANNRRVDPITDLWTLTDAAGSLPLVASQQPESTYTAAGLEAGPFYYWSVRARDGRGASRGTSAWWFTGNAPPSVAAGPDLNTTLAAPTVALNGAVSDDGFPVAAALSVAWTQVGGPAPVVFDAPAAATTTATLSEVGTYVLRLTADDSLLSAWDEVTIQVGPAPAVNQPPAVNAGPDPVIVLPATSTLLRGVVSDDGRPNGSLSLLWSQLGGPGPVHFDTPDVLSTVVSFPGPGVYDLRLSASDSELLTSDDLRAVVEDFPDLTPQAVDVSALQYDGQTLQVSGAAQVTVANGGAGTAQAAFDVTVFEDRNANQTFEPSEDVALGTSTAGPLAGGGTELVQVPLSGGVLFRSNLVHVFVDSASSVAERDETNNYADSKPPCQPTPSALPFAPQLEWAWTGSTVLPSSNNVMMTPLVVDLTADGLPEVVFNTFAGESYLGGGQLRAVDGRTGSLLFSVTPSGGVRGSAAIAAADIDRDGRPEIVAVHGSGQRLVAFEHDGTLKWLSAFLAPQGYGGPAIADLDADGLPEIIAGRQVVNADGTLRWTGTAGAAWNGEGSLPLVADVNMDGSPDVVAGNTVYRADGTILWNKPAIGDGFNAVGNFDADPLPEIVLVSSGTVRLLEHDGTVKWGPVPIPGGGWGGAPTVADVDGDGLPEIGVAGATRYVVLETDGAIKWAATTRDASSNATGSTVFDFEGDGSAEVVYGDEVKLRIFRGSDGSVLWERPLSTCTTFENPVIADVDADGNAELVAVGNTACGFGPDHGVYVFGDANDNWLATRRVWNQHTYHITNVNDDATIPTRESNSWQGFNNYRQNRLTSGCEYARPDLTASYVRKDAAGPDVMLSIRIGNGGALVIGSGIPVALYDGEPAPGKAPIATIATTRYLNPGEYEDLLATLSSSVPARPLWVVADDRGGLDGTQVESDEANNLHNSRIFLTPVPNEAPVVAAGPDQSLTLPAGVLLDATVNDDGQPLGTLAFSWTQLSGPGTVEFGSPASEDTTASLPAAGSYVLRLTASDGDLSGYDEVLVNVSPANQPPVVNAGPDVSVNGLSAVLTGTATDDGLPSGALTVAWSQVSGPSAATLANPAALTTTVQFQGEGVYGFRLSASDSSLSASDEVVVSVAFVNQPPVVDAGPSVTITLPQNQVALDGTVTDDGLPPGSAVTAAWSLVAGPAPVQVFPPDAVDATANFSAPGSYTLRLTATDSSLTASDSVGVTVLPAPPTGPPPSVSITSPQDGDRITEPVPVVASVSSGTLAAWTLEHRLAGAASWTPFASATTPAQDGTVATLDPTTLLNGSYQLRLSATDNAGRTTRTTVSAVVRDNLKVGNFSVSFVDLEVPVAGLPIRVTRTYDSRDKGVGDFGFGWRLDLSTMRVGESRTPGLEWRGTASQGAFPTYCIPETRPHVVTVTDPSGRVHEFETVLTPQCQPFAPMDVVRVGFRARPGSLGTLAVAGNDEALVVGSFPGSIELYDSSTYELFDPAAYQYSSPDGRSFLIREGSGVERLDDLNGNRLTVGPNGITHSSGKGVAFTRDGQGRITRITDPSGRSLNYGYDGDGDLVSVTDRENAATRFSYVANQSHLLEDIQDPLGRTPIRNEYDDGGRLIRHTDAFGATIEYTHDLGTRQEIVKDRNDRIRVLEYDSRGNVVKETQPDGRIVRRSFDTRNNRTSETEPHDASSPSPPTTHYTYDAADNLLSVTDAVGNSTQHTYNGRQQVLTARDPRGRFTVNTYDANGNLTGTKSGGASASGPFLTATTHTYDARGNLKTQTTVVDGAAQVTSYDHDGFGNLTKETDALAHATSYAYDGSGNRLSQTTTRTLPGGGSETLLTLYTYDNNGRLTRTTDPDGTSVRTVYDALGRQVESHDKLQRRTSFEYDEMGRLTRTTYPDSTHEESTYDPEGRRLTSRDRGGRTTTYEYDQVGRLRKTTYPDLTFTENSYDAAGRLVATRDARGKTTTYEYDAAGRRTKVRDPLGNETVFTYDANGNQRSVRDARLNTTTFEYDNLNRRIRTDFPNSTFTETAYDTLGRRVSEEDQAGRVTRYQYDELGRLTKVIDALDQATAYSYDEVGNRTLQRDANGHETRFEYDRLGRELARTLPDGARETKTYNAAGNLETRTDFMGRTTTYTYDDNNRLASRSCPNPAENVSFTYTATGRRASVTDTRGVTTHGYDLRDRLVSLVQPGVGSLAYAYDGNGGRTALTVTHAGQTYNTAYSYDDASRLDLVTDPANRVYDLGHDATGNRSSLQHPNGTATAYTYDSLNRLTNLTTTGPLGTVQSYAFTLGPAGNRTRIDEADGTVREFSYDALYRLTGETVRGNLTTLYNKAFSYDPVGNRRAQTTTGGGPPGLPPPGTVEYAYDTRDRLLTENASALTYDANGNLTGRVGEVTYVWDHENRLIRATKADGTITETTYDADGNRVATRITPPTGPSTTTHYLVDVSGGLSQVVAETNGANALQALYVRGSDDLLSVLRPDGVNGWITRFFHADGIGSVRRLTNEAGTITDGYTYTAFGEPLSHTGSDPQPYAFAGEPYDPNVGFQYHRARWMDPRVGRFASLDPFAGLDDDPPSLHEYAYGHDDPVDQRDPSGESIAGAALTGLTIGLALYSIADAVLDPEATTGTILFAAGVEIIPGSAYAKGGRLLAAKLGLKAMFRVWRAGRKFKGAIAHFAAAATTKEWKDVFFRAFPDLRGNVVVHHAVERDVANLYPHLKLDIYQLNCLENLRGIPKDANPSAHLSQIRLRWNDFYRRHEANPAAVTLQDLLEHARIIDDEFGHLFIPPWR